METLIPTLLLSLLLPLTLYFVTIVRRKPSEDRKNLPPGSNGWPVLGENLDYAMLGSQQLVTDRMQKYSPNVFKTTLFGSKMAVLCGAEGNKLIFKNETKLFKSWLPPSLMKVLHPESVDMDTSNESKAIFRSFHNEVLKPDALKQYILVMDEMARHHLVHEWNPSSIVKVLPSSKKYTFELSCRLFMNVVDVERLQKLLEPFSAMTDGMVSQDLDLPMTAFRRAVEGGRVVRNELKRIIEERRKDKATEMREGVDLLSRMVMVMDEDGKHLSDVMIANFMMGLLIATQYEVSYAITGVLYFLAQFPHIYDQVLKEQMEIVKSKGPDDHPLAWHDIGKMKYTWNVVSESFRLIPPALGSFRESATEFDYAGFTIPKGWKIMWSVHSCHKNPDYFPEPEKFDPSRFEGSGPAPYTYVPFGGGSRICPGREYAKLVILVFIHNVVTRFRLERVIPDEKLVFHATTRPAHGLPLHLHPHKK